MPKLQGNPTLPSATILVFVSIASTQLGSALAKTVIQELGSVTTVLMRVGFGAVVLLLLQRPKLKGYNYSAYGLLILFGLVMAAMNLSFYAAIEQIPLGIAVTLEFLGPLGVACLNSRQLLYLFWIFLAGIGIFLLAPITGSSLEPLGVTFALLAAICWGAYILLSAKVGKVFAETKGIALMTAALAAGTVVLLPFGILSTGITKLEPKFLAIGLGVANLSSAIPYTVELAALKKIPIRVFGVLMSLEPAIATLLGLIILKETISDRALVAIILVSLASLGSSLFEKRRSLD
ncbi:MAG: DMT family transporter [Pleurocapsa sp.]